MKLEFRSITNNALTRDNSVMMSSAMPSAKYSHAGSPLRLPKGMTATDGLFNGGSDLFPAGLVDEEGGRLGRSAVTTLAEEVRTFANLSHEADALPRYRADQPLVLSTIANSLSRGVDAARQRQFRDDPSAPYRRNEVVFAHYPVTVLDQKISRSKTCGSTGTGQSRAAAPGGRRRECNQRT